MIAEEYKNILELYKQSSTKSIQSDTLEKVFFQSFVWHFTEKRNWKDEILKKHAIKLEITMLENVLNGETSEKNPNYYYNQMNQYLHYSSTENQTIKMALGIATIKGEIILNYREILKAILETGFKRNQIKPEEFINKIEQEANDLNKQNVKLSSKINNTILGYQTKYDNRSEPLTKALVQFKSYLSDYGKQNNSLAESRFKSCLGEIKVEEYFQQLLKVNETESRFKGKPILQKEELNNLLHSNFRNFNPARSKQVITANCTNTTLYRFFREFCDLENNIYSVSPTIFHKMLKSNFSSFRNTELEIIKKEFSRPRSNNYPFD